jgi:myo-inositol-1(or 4)-monophosphatase
VVADRVDLLDLALATTLAAGRLLIRHRGAGAVRTSTKSSPRDLVTDADRAAEALIVARLRQRRPHDGILGEESGERPGTSGVRWIVDPLDGTANFVHGLPAFVVSVAAEVDGVVVLGVVHDPSRAETFTATLGCGAHCNGRPIRVSDRRTLESALLGTGFSRDLTIRAAQAARLGDLAGRVLDVRHSGSAALDLCAVAAGRLDVYFEADTRIWDRAAGALIATEAGGVVCAADGGPPSDAMLVAGPAALTDALRAALV